MVLEGWGLHDFFLISLLALCLLAILSEAQETAQQPYRHRHYHYHHHLPTNLPKLSSAASTFNRSINAPPPLFPPGLSLDKIKPFAYGLLVALLCVLVYTWKQFCEACIRLRQDFFRAVTGTTPTREIQFFLTIDRTPSCQYDLTSMGEEREEKSSKQAATIPEKGEEMKEMRGEARPLLASNVLPMYALRRNQSNSSLRPPKS